ncbi:hypothetical protein RhiirB3_443433, partial [Rhizophagus irregularis]
MQQELFSPFLNNLEKLFKSKKDYDVIIKAGEDNDQKEIYAHSNILRYDLALDEIEVWNNLIRWAHAQQPTVHKDPLEWTKDELTLMERTLLRFIPLIRFYDIISEEYYDKVVPYEDLLPKKLKNEILKFYLIPQAKQIGSLPSRNAVINSALINSKHLALFAGCIDKKDKSLKMIPYKFNLIFRASRDGNTAAAFHNK